MAEINNVTEYLIGLLSQLIDKTTLKTRLDSIDERLSRLEANVKTFTPRESHKPEERKYHDRKKHFDSRRTDETSYVYDLHGNKVPVKETMSVKKYSYTGQKQGRCKVWGCDERAVDKGYCSKHLDKYYQKETGGEHNRSQEQPKAFEPSRGGSPKGRRKPKLA